MIEDFGIYDPFDFAQDMLTIVDLLFSSA